MLYNRKKKFVKELSTLFNDVSITDKKGNIFYSINGKIHLSKITDKDELCKLKSKFDRNINKVKFRYSDEKLKQRISKVVYIGKEPVLIRMHVSSDKTTFSHDEASNSTLKVVMEHDARIYTDLLTGVYNRLYLTDFLMQKEINAVAMVDVDDFKKINDTYGHVVGDIVLQNIAKTILLSVGRHGKVVRFGGDEFVVVFEKIDKDLLQTLLKDISKQTSSLQVENIKEKLSVSIGASFGSGHVEALLDRADKAMYQLKREKKQA